MPSTRRPAAALLLLTMLAVGGCEPPDSAGGRIEVRYWTGWTGNALACQKELAAEFEQRNPRIRVRILSVAGAYQKVRISFAGGTTPDLCSAIWADELAGYALRGILRPLDGYMAKSGRRGDEFVPGVWRMLQYEGRPYALAVTTNTNFLVYNRDVFRQSGLDPDRGPRTIDELDAAAQACTKTRPDGGFVRSGYRPSGLVLWAYVFGGQWYDPARREVTANDPRNVAALRWMAAYGQRFDVARMQSFESTFGRATSPSGPFFVGKLAMWQTGEWAQGYLRRYAPNLAWGYCPMPVPPGGRSNTTLAAGSVFAIPRDARHPDEAWALLNFLTHREPVERFCAAIQNLPALRAAAPAFRKDPLLDFALNLAGGEHCYGPPQMPVWPHYLQGIQRAEDYAVFGRQDPGRLLDDLDRDVERELARALADSR